MTQLDLATYTGIGAIVVALVSGAKLVFKALVKGREPRIAFFLILAIGVAAKLTVAGAFADVSWLAHVLSLLMTSFGAKLTHDHLINEVAKGVRTSAPVSLIHSGNVTKLLAICLIPLLLVSCCVPPVAARQAAEEIGDSHRDVIPEYVAYVNADAKLTADQKDRRIKLAQSLDRLVLKLKMALKE